jgi:protein involved in temperature-dependent protein secretion
MTVESEHKKIIPGAVRRAVDDVLAKRKAGQGKKASATGQQAQKTGVQAQQQTDNNKFEWISDSPTRLGLKVDFRRGGIQADNTAYVVGHAKPVKWKRK